jgi:hypothetical protein
MPSAAHEYFKLIFGQADPFAYLNNLPGEPEPVLENEWRDFKEYKGGEKELRNCWSEALSAFTNTGGGVVVWGISARRGDSGIDRVDASHPLDKPDEWAGKLKAWILEATNPPASGVEIKVAKDKKGRGFVVCLIPESQSKPHRMEFDKRKPYLIRVADNCVPPNPALLRSMFFPRPRADIDLVLRSSPSRDRGKSHSLFLELQNVGDTSVVEGALAIDCPAGSCSFESGRDSCGFVWPPNDRSAAILVHRTFHPGARYEMGTIQHPERYVRLEFRLRQLNCPPLGIWAEPDLHQSREDRFRLAPKASPAEPPDSE